MSLSNLTWSELYNLRDRHDHGSPIHNAVCAEIARREEEQQHV